MKYETTVESPLGPIGLESDGTAITAVRLRGRCQAERKDAILRRAEKQLKEYFAGRRRAFDLPLKTEGTEFQKQVWRELARIPYGKCLGYGEIARRIGRPQASRAVGNAVGRNPLAILLPCHRVIAANRRLGGFTGGTDLKVRLLDLEGISLRP